MAATERLIQRGDGVGFPRTNRVINSATIDIIDDNGFRIGFVLSMSESLNRDVTRVRHLNSLDAGRTVEQAPGVEEASLTLNGYSLYDRSLTEKGSLIHRLGGPVAAAKSLMGQRVPFNIVMVEVHPGSGERTVTNFIDCWIRQYTRSRNIQTSVQTDQVVCQVGIRD